MDREPAGSLGAPTEPKTGPFRLGSSPPGRWLAAYAIPASLASAGLAGLPPQGISGYPLGGLGHALLGSSRPRWRSFGGSLRPVYDGYSCGPDINDLGKSGSIDPSTPPLLFPGKL